MATTVFDDARPRPEDSKPRTTRRGLVIRLAIMAVLLALVVGGLYGFNRMREKGMANYFAHMTAPPTPVSAVEAKVGSVPNYLMGIGSVAAVRQVMVAPEVGGRVTKLMFEPGADVKAGDPLVQLDDGPERGDLASYESQAHLAQLNLDRAKSLAKRDFAAQATVDQNAATLQQAQAGIAKTQALIEQKLIRAPFPGVLGIREVQLGQYVQPGTTLVTLTDLDTLWVNFTLPERDRSKIAVGQRVGVTVDAYPGRTFEGKLTAIEPQIDPTTRVIRLQATLANPGRLLQPGMFANAKLALPPTPDVVTLPETAVTSTLYGNSVYLVEKAGQAKGGKQELRAKETVVTTGQQFDGRVAIRSGVKAGDLVVASGQIKLHDGAPVTVENNTPPPIPAEPPLE
jgi:multidrug efflux system membrane fusion protein